MISDAVEGAQKAGYVDEGDVVIITGGSVDYGVGTTNLMKVHLIERVLAHGTGVGEARVTGRIRCLTPPFDDSLRFDSDEIVVLPYTSPACIPILRRVAGLVTAESSQDAQDLLLAVEMGIPAVTGIREGVEVFTDGMHVVLDAKRGVVYERPEALVHTVE